MRKLITALLALLFTAAGLSLAVQAVVEGISL